MRILTQTLWIFALSCVYISPSYAQNQPISGPEIKALLAGKTVAGTGFSQMFFGPKENWPAGTTYDDGGNLTFGKWEVQGHRYCSFWPPNPSWSCYTVASWEKAGEIWVAWIDEDGRRFEGKIEQ